MSCHFLLQGIFWTQGSNPSLLCLLLVKQILYHWAIWEDCWIIYALLSPFCKKKQQQKKRYSRCKYLKNYWWQWFSQGRGSKIRWRSAGLPVSFQVFTKKYWFSKYVSSIHSASHFLQGVRDKERTDKEAMTFAGLGWDDGINLLQRQIKIIQKNKPRDDFGKR